MKLLVVTSLLLICPIASMAQRAAESNTPPGVAILKINSRTLIRSRDWDASRNSATNQSIDDSRNLPSRDPNASQSPTPMGTTPVVRARDGTSQTRVARPGDHPIPADASAVSGQKLPEYTYEARIKNVGEGTIVAVAWEYLFLEPGSGNQLARHRFYTFRKAPSGKSLTLSGRSIGPPTRVISAADTTGRLFEERVVIKCVAYSDGTVRWLATDSERACDDIRSRNESKR
jgi:hypothetical protein